MSEILQFILIAAAAIVVLCIALKLFKVAFKTIFKVALNAAVGIGAIFLLNLIPGVAIPVTWWSALITGIFGIPGAIGLLVLSFFL